MRVGFNPHKDKEQSKSEFFHQVVIPVYIPNQEGYFKDSLEILKLCLDSVLLTSHNKTYFTIVNNGSCKEVTDYLNELFSKNKIQEVIQTSNIGKLNAVLKGIAGNDFELVTVSDADVLFLYNWQKATYDIFENFPKTGVVCPTPSSRSLRTYTSNIYWDMFFSKQLQFSDVQNPNALKMFGNSVGNDDFYNKFHLQKYLTISNNNEKAVVGAGHFIATYRNDVFGESIKKYSNYKLGGDSEAKMLDIPVVKKGYWRLSTAENYAYHLGNVAEDWMYVEKIKIQENTFLGTVVLSKKVNTSGLSYFIKSKLFAKFILNKKIMRYFLIWKGLTKEEAKDYLI